MRSPWNIDATQLADHRRTIDIDGCA